uniref:ShKT domain-containing protein n=1 Tax=Strongyloides papillosus TaxID=174720 RepID=A0A0N5B2C0_STREA
MFIYLFIIIIYYFYIPINGLINVSNFSLDKLLLNDETNDGLRYKLSTKFSVKANAVGDKCVSHFDCIHFNAGCAFDQQTKIGVCLYLCDSNRTNSKGSCNDREICKEEADSFTSKNLYLPLPMCIPVECKEDNHCDINEICQENYCVVKTVLAENITCSTNSDCVDEDTVCDRNEKICSSVQCSTDNECSNFNGICNVGTNTCIQIPQYCNNNKDCISKAYVCDTLIQTCILEDVSSNYHCRDHKDCQKESSLASICDKSRNVCIIPPTCKNNFNCQKTTGYCDMNTLTCNVKESNIVVFNRPPKFNTGKVKSYETEIQTQPKDFVCFSDQDCTVANYFCDKSTKRCRENKNEEFVEIANTISEMLTLKTSCVDVAGNCKKYVKNCLNPKYKSMMKYACSRSCNFCSDSIKTKKHYKKNTSPPESKVILNKIPKKVETPVCKDNIRFRHHVINCEDRKNLCKQKMYYEFMRVHCSKTCGFCKETPTE